MLITSTIIDIIELIVYFKFNYFFICLSLMTLRESYHRIFEQISEQRLPGIYTKNRPYSCYKTVLALGICNIFLLFI